MSNKVFLQEMRKFYPDKKWLYFNYELLNKYFVNIHTQNEIAEFMALLLPNHIENNKEYFLLYLVEKLNYQIEEKREKIIIIPPKNWKNKAQKHFILPLQFIKFLNGDKPVIAMAKAAIVGLNWINPKTKVPFTYNQKLKILKDLYSFKITENKINWSIIIFEKELNK